MIQYQKFIQTFSSYKEFDYTGQRDVTSGSVMLGKLYITGDFADKFIYIS